LREEVRQIQRLLEEQVYIADAAIATALYLSMTLGKPLLVEGPAGVGKTEIAKALSSALQTKLIRLQCYEGLDATTALYEWNYPKQLLHLKLEETSAASEAEKEAMIFSETFLLKRPLLQAITEHDRAPVLLIDEIDRSDEEFEAFLLEVLSDFQVTIPEIGPIKATHRPHVVLTSNRSRDLSDALRRRCLYHWIDYPSLEKELEIVRAKVPGIAETLSSQLTKVMQATRTMSRRRFPALRKHWIGPTRS
jgi:MoxR-like ATPase